MSDVHLSPSRNVTDVWPFLIIFTPPYVFAKLNNTAVDTTWLQKLFHIKKQCMMPNFFLLKFTLDEHSVTAKFKVKIANSTYRHATLPACKWHSTARCYGQWNSSTYRIMHFGGWQNMNQAWWHGAGKVFHSKQRVLYDKHLHSRLRTTTLSQITAWRT